MVAVSPSGTPAREIFGVALIEVPAPLSSALKGAALMIGTVVSIRATTGGVGLDALLAVSVMTAVILHAPSIRVGKVHERIDVVVVKEHCTT